MFLRKRRPAAQLECGLTLVEVAIAVALLGLVAAAAIAALMSLNKNAVATRVMTNAREIVQRNIENAIAAPFNSSSEPNILKITNASGVVWDDAGGTGTVNVYTSRDGTSTVTGVLKRIVVAETNPVSADLRRVTFHLDYPASGAFLGRTFSYEMTTIRAMDR
jgi:prepilin-type N-terminal cleavage/methylation domain-containing protein